MGLFSAKSNESHDTPEPVRKDVAIWRQSLMYNGGASPWRTVVSLRVNNVVHVDECRYWSDPAKANEYLAAWGDKFAAWCEFQKAIEFETEYVCP